MDSAYRQCRLVAEGTETYVCDGCAAVLSHVTPEGAAEHGWRCVDAKRACWRCDACLGLSGGGNRRARRAAAAGASRR